MGVSERTLIDHLGLLYNSKRPQTSDDLGRRTGNSRSWTNRCLVELRDRKWAMTIPRRRRHSALWVITDRGALHWHELYPETAPRADPAEANHRYPNLDALRGRYEQRVHDERLVESYVRAADVLRAVDPDEADRLIARADAIVSASLGPVEIEYLRYAEEHPS